MDVFNQQDNRKLTILIRLLALIIILFLHYSEPLFATKNFPAFLNSNGVADVAHYYIPASLNFMGKLKSEWLFWMATFPLQIFYIGIVFYILVTGRGIRLGICLYLVNWMHWLFWHFTVLSPPDYIVWSFPVNAPSLTGSQFSQDFWFSGHTVTMMLITLAAYETTSKLLKIGVLFWFAAVLFIIITVRVHYSIDILGAIFVAYSVYKFSYTIQPYAEKIVLRIGGI